jgi:hypothetical protein
LKPAKRTITSTVRAVLVIGLLFGAGAAAPETSPVPPCAAAKPSPNYASEGAAPKVQVWTKTEDWSPPSCIGWSATDSGVLVALAARFRFAGTRDALLLRFGAISSLKGLRYWSVTEGGWRTLIIDAFALDGPDLNRKRPDFTLAEMKSGKELYFAQKDNRAAGDVIYRMQVKEMSATRLVVAVDNVSPVERFMLTLFNPGGLRSLQFLERQGPDVWSYYGLAWAGETTAARLAVPEASYVNRAKALYAHFAGLRKPEP